MGWDGSGNVVRNTGVFSGSTAWQQTRDASRKIRADDHDTHDEDLATAIENTITRDGQNAPVDDLPMGGNRHINCGEGLSLNSYSTLGQDQKSATHICTVSGTANAIVLTSEFPPTAYVIGHKFVFFATAANTGAVTVNVNGLGVVAVNKRGGNALESGDIVTGELVVLYYNGTVFQLSTLSNQGLGKTGDQVITKVDPGGTVGPTLTLDRNSASPEIGDVIGEFIYSGRDSVGQKTNYAGIRAYINSPTDTAEVGGLRFMTMVGGVVQPRFNIVTGIFAAAASGADMGAGSANFTGVYDDGNQIHATQDGLKTAQATTSGTAFDFTGIRSDARRITIMFAGVSLSGTEDFLVQIGDSGGLETTGYVSSSTVSSSGGVATSFSTTGFVMRSQTAATVFSGHMILTLLDPATNQWAASHTGKRDTNASIFGGGDKSLSAVLDRIRVTRTGTDTFDAGAINILVE